MQIAVSALLVSVFVLNFTLGLLPYVDNFSSIGGFISGFLLGSSLLVSPQLAPNKAGLIDYGLKSYIKQKLKRYLDRPIMRIVSLVLLCLMYAVIFSDLFCLVCMALNPERYLSFFSPCIIS